MFVFVDDGHTEAQRAAIDALGLEYDDALEAIENAHDAATADIQLEYDEKMRPFNEALINKIAALDDDYRAKLAAIESGKD